MSIIKIENDLSKNILNINNYMNYLNNNIVNEKYKKRILKCFNEQLRYINFSIFYRRE